MGDVDGLVTVATWERWKSKGSYVFLREIRGFAYWWRKSKGFQSNARRKNEASDAVKELCNCRDEG